MASNVAVKKVLNKLAAKDAAAEPKKPGTAVVSWEEALANKAKGAKKVASNIGGGSRNILSFKGGRLSYQGGLVPGNQIDVVVLSAIQENNFYKGTYDPNNPASPVCYAFGRPDGDDENMAPLDVVPDRQSDLCRECPQNEWGSAETGRGKACKNMVSLAMVTSDALESAEDLRKAEVFYAKLPVTSTKAWKGFVNECGDRHYMEFVTRVSAVPKGETFEVTFDAQSEVDRGVMGAVVDKSDKEDAKWGEPYPVFEPREQPARGRGAVGPGGPRASAKPAAKPRKY